MNGGRLNGLIEVRCGNVFVTLVFGPGDDGRKPFRFCAANGHLENEKFVFGLLATGCCGVKGNGPCLCIRLFIRPGGNTIFLLLGGLRGVVDVWNFGGKNIVFLCFDLSLLLVLV